MSIINVSGQSSLTGRVINESNSQPIEDVNIIMLSGRGTTSNKNGEFSIEIDQFPVILKLSHVAYQPREVLIRSPLESGLTISMVGKTTNIQEVQVSAERFHRYFKNEYFYVVDYNFIDKNIILAGFDKSNFLRGRLTLVNLSGDTLDYIPVNMPKRLFRDGFGNIHLFSGDSVYQIAFINNHLRLMYPTHEKNFITDLLKLQIAEDHRFLFKEIHGDGQLDLYYRIDTITNTIDTLAWVFDRKLFPDARTAGRHNESSLPEINLDYLGKMDSLSGFVQGANWLFQFTYFDNFVLHNPITSQIFEYNYEYIIVDLANYEIHALIKDSLKERTIQMDIPRHSHRIKYFVQDEITHKIYWVYYQGNKALLGELDPVNGKIVKQMETPELPFIESIKIRNGVIWFLHQPRIGEAVKSLYRFQL